jgi:uncharacterized membrane protein YphA (DoxX/SURF4 family)
VKIAFLCRLALAAIFMITGIMKFGDAQGFAYDLHLFDVTPWPLSKILAFYLPGFEIIAGITLLIPRLRLGALFAVLCMSAAFSAAISSIWIRGLDISCGCFGQGQSVSNYPLHLAATLAMSSVAAWLIYIERDDCV